jgi:uncharacterized tellurite resistance protein B-like protein
MTKPDARIPDARTLKELDRPARLRLMMFVCSFAWADLEVRNAERDFVARLVSRLDLDGADREQVALWLEVPPAADALDPAGVPLEHRMLFIEVIEGVIISDGEIAPEERENLELLRELLS